ncbi:hypothetical protein ABBQ32_002027 [Trebouxia sp. C0010 RCD-2024]
MATESHAPLLVQLTYLDLGGNAFKGTLPEAYHGLTNLSYLNLGGNALLVHQHQGLRCWWEHPHPPAGNDTRF